jgi:hypothetical protein
MALPDCATGMSSSNEAADVIANEMSAMMPTARAPTGRPEVSIENQLYRIPDIRDNRAPIR